MNEYYKDLYEFYEQMLLKTKGNEADNDSEFQTETRRQIKKRDKEYTGLLEHFVKLTKARNVIREIFKWLFMIIVIGCMIAIVVITGKLFSETLSRAESIKQIKDVIPILITSIVGFVSTVITIPVTMTKYLFSTKEDENITKIILHTQEHDNNGRKLMVNQGKMKDYFKKNNDYKDGSYKTEKRKAV